MLLPGFAVCPVSGRWPRELGGHLERLDSGRGLQVGGGLEEAVSMRWGAWRHGEVGSCSPEVAIDSAAVR